MSSDRLRAGVLGALAPMAWGTTYLVTTRLLPPHVALLGGTLRALPVGLVILLVYRRLPAGIWRYRVALLGALNFSVVFGLVFVAAYRLPGGVAATIGAVQPLVVTGLSWLILRERPSLRQLLAGGLGLCGVALLVLTPTARLDLVGVGAGAGATISFALGTVLTRQWGRPAPALLFTGWQLVAGGLWLLPFAILFETLPTAVTPANMAGIAWLCVIGTGLAYTIWFRALDHLSAPAASFLLLLNPIVAVIAGALVNGERLGVVPSLGAVVIVLAVAMGSTASARAGEWRARLPATVA